MKIRPIRWLISCFVLLIFLSCSRQIPPPDNSIPNQALDLESFPYNPLAYHLDLSILAYHLYGQSLIWPFDPYYEEVSKPRKDRIQLMNKVREWAKSQGIEQGENNPGLKAYRGPGVLNGFADNPSHDPIIYRYDQLYPWSPNITNALDSWIEYLTPKAITSPIKEVYVAYQESGKSQETILLEKVASRPDVLNQKPQDVLLAFEGGTGDKGVPGQVASQSLMGFVLLRYHSGGPDYDIHIVFRGSRSGAGARAALQALSDNNAKGNPDWITDLGYNLIGSNDGAGHITQMGTVSRGMSTSMKSMLPNLFYCLKKVADLNPSTPPKRIFVTGHSLGGGLAQVFVSAIFLGDQYAPNGTGAGMPDQLRSWPWESLKLITFSAPRVGDAIWAEKLSREHLASDFFSTTFNPFDKEAIRPINASILPGLLRLDQAAGYRVLIPSDPISTEKIPGGKHVGKTVYVRKPKMRDYLPPPDVNAHEPAELRKQLLSNLKDPRIPSIAWNTRKMKALNPERIKADRGSKAEYLKVIKAMENYYRDNDYYIDFDRLQSNGQLFLKIYEQ